MVKIKEKNFQNEINILDFMYLLMFGICLFELFFHTSYISKTENWIGTVLVGSHKVWDRMIYSLTISISLLRFSVQTEVTRIQRFFVWLILFVFSFHYLATGMHLDVLVFGCLCIGAYNISFSKIIKIYFFESMILYGIVVITSMAGLITATKDFGVRASYGFIHPNTFGVHTMTIIMAYFVWRKTKMTWTEIGIAAIIELIVFRTSVSRSSFIGTVLFLFICVCYKLYLHIKDIKAVKMVYDVLMYLMSFSVFIFGGIMVLLSYFYSENRAWMVKLDQWFSTRLSLSRTGFDKYNVSLLGKPVKMITEPKEGEVYFFLDSYYIRSIFEWGILMVLVFMMLYFIVSYRAKCMNEFLLLSALSVLALHGMMEVCMSSFIYNPYLLFLLASTGKEKLAQQNGGTE